jgi:hypothetical protein
MRRRAWTVLVGVASGIGLAGAQTAPAQATIHEIVAAYCSGGDVGVITGLALEAPGVSTFGTPAFARPVLASGAVDFPLTTDKPNVKVLPGLDAPTFEVSADTIDHPSEHCKAMR